jgi:Dehydrogenases with different specificities (related to short-chain alcohol dehydrogenases)
MSGVEDLFDVRDARVVVTGAASGLGLAMAEVMAGAGARVTLADLDPDRLETERARLADAGGQVRSFQLDVSDRDQVQALIDDVVSEQDGVDVLYANAGISLEPGFTDPKGGIAAIESEAWDKVIGVNLNGVVFTIGAAAEVMKKQGAGKIVVTASNAGLKVEPLVGYSYAATKAAVIHVVRQAAVELAPHGVNINAIAPGPFRTRIGSGELPNAKIEGVWADLIPVGRMAETDELKGLALMLGSPAASFITGAVVLIDGGAMPSPFGKEVSLG